MEGWEDKKRWAAFCTQNCIGNAGRSGPFGPMATLKHRLWAEICSPVRPAGQAAGRCPITTSKSTMARGARPSQYQYHRMLVFRGGDDLLVQKSGQMSAEGVSESNGLPSSIVQL
jgi:hypothetical protein